MSNCGLPPGVGVSPSLFPVNKIYHTVETTYTDVPPGISMLTEAVYKDVSGNVILTVALSYTADLDPIYNGNTYVDHSYNIHTAGFEVILDRGEAAKTSRQAHTANEIETLGLLSLTTVNLANDNSGYDIIVTGDGDLVYIGSIE